MSLSPVEGLALAEIESDPDATTPAAKGVVGRSPGQLAWMRLRRDRTAVVSGVLLVFFMVLGWPPR